MREVTSSGMFEIYDSVSDELPFANWQISIPAPPALSGGRGYIKSSLEEASLRGVMTTALSIGLTSLLSQLGSFRGALVGQCV
ncbi:hypothetical protein CEXT_3141 [Caerostris extrusa]|uniref:Uncharacterized protein n=1 Tax=Caerostris extrusa TaxID=172846 RepID=A0AAV4WJ34_CAEEX|nr:hypothetical protein CEXT_3141 [Caerostris extrusa]